MKITHTFTCLALLIVCGCQNYSSNDTHNNPQVDTPNQLEPTADSNTVTDIDGNVYDTVTIGKQTWMVQNLKTTRYRNGDPIPEIQNAKNWTMARTGAHCFYNNDKNHLDDYGRLYNWYAATDKRNICPEGWHIPTREEWQELISYLGGDKKRIGSKLKETGFDYWENKNTDASNETGFSGRGAGVRVNMAMKGMNMKFNYFHKNGVFWAATPASQRHAYAYWLKGYNRELYESRYGKFSGFSIRCIKD